MSYQVLARKWRPKTFAEMVGQEHVLRALGNGLANDRLHHAYLFAGTRGVGKTTLARILTKCLNCEEKGVTAEPCGECGACRDVDSGRFVDLIELDAASRTGVDQMRELLDNVQYAPARGRFKVYLIDEIHMLSGHSFNALLKTLEEPPPHVKFLLATTDPQKLPVTVLSRCLRFNLRHLAPSLIANHLARVLSSEGITYDSEAVTRLSRAAEGSMRDALSLLDQAIAHAGGELRDDAVREMLGTLDRDFVFSILEALAAGDGPAMLSVSARMAEFAPDFDDALAETLSVLYRLALLQSAPGTVAEEEPDRSRLEALAGTLTPEAVQLAYQITLQGRRDLGDAPDPRAGFEMVLLRLLAFRPATPADASHGDAATALPGEAASEYGTVGSGASSPGRGPVAPSSSTAAPTEGASAEVRDTVEEDAVPQAPGAGGPPAGADASETVTDGDDWPRVVAALNLSGLAQALASHCDWVGRDADRVRLRIDEGHGHLVNPGRSARLEAALSEHLGTPVKVHVEIGEPISHTPAELDARVRADRQARAEAAIESDPNIAALRETFDAEVVPESVRPSNH